MRFRKAAEAALELAVPDRAVWLRALLAELERLANHFGDIGAICNDASFTLIHAHCGVLRESILRAANAAFGHRLMRDVIVPGGVTRDLDEAGEAIIRAALDNIRLRFAELVELYDNTASLQDRTVDTGVLKPALATNMPPAAMSGAPPADPSMRAATLPIRHMTICDFEVPVLNEGDVNARVWIRVREIEQVALTDRPDPGRLPDGRAGDACGSHPARRGRAWRSSRDFAATCWSGSACAMAASNAATCATRHGSSGRCSRR